MVLKVEGGVLPDFRVYGGKTFAKVEENNVNFFLRNKKRHRDSNSACSKKNSNLHKPTTTLPARSIQLWYAFPVPEGTS
jgi:hypothetical protein